MCHFNADLNNRHALAAAAQEKPCACIARQAIDLGMNMFLCLTLGAVCGISARQLSHCLGIRGVPAAAVEEADGMREVVKAGAPPAAHMADSVVQEAAVGPGSYH